jgi:hypothetical protein
MELDSIKQQVSEVEMAVTRRAPVEATAVLEGLGKLSSLVASVVAQTDGACTDHIESGREDAQALAQHLKEQSRMLLESISSLSERVRGASGPGGGAFVWPELYVPYAVPCSTPPSSNQYGPWPLNQASDPSTSHVLHHTAAGLVGAEEGGAPLSRQAAFDVTYLPPASDRPLSGISASPTRAQATAAGAEDSLMPVEDAGGAAEAEAEVAPPEALASDTVLYSWGRADLGALLQGGDRGEGVADRLAAPARSKYSQKNFANLVSRPPYRPRSPSGA